MEFTQEELELLASALETLREQVLSEAFRHDIDELLVRLNDYAAGDTTS